MTFNSEQWHAQWQAKREAEIGRAIPEFKDASKRLRSQVVDARPAIIVVSGASADIAETALAGLPSELTRKIRRFSPELNKALYGGYSLSDTEDLAKLLLGSEQSQLSKKGKLIMVDDHASSGEKARRIPIMLGRLGFPNVEVAVLVANPDPYYAKFIEEVDLFKASTNPDLYREVELLARGISGAKYGMMNGRTPDARNDSSSQLVGYHSLLHRLAK